MSTDTPTNENTNRFDTDIYNLELGLEMPEFEDTPCTSMDHEGRPAMVVAIGPNGQDVRVAKVCTECRQAVEEVAYQDAIGLVIEGRGRTINRLKNEPNEERQFRIPAPYDELAEEVEDPVITTLQLDPIEQEIVVGYIDAEEDSDSAAKTESGE